MDSKRDSSQTHITCLNANLFICLFRQPLSHELPNLESKLHFWPGMAHHLMLTQSDPYKYFTVFSPNQKCVSVNFKCSVCYLTMTLPTFTEHQKQMNKWVHSIAKMILIGKTNWLREKPVPVPPHLMQISHSAAWDRNWDIMIEFWMVTIQLIMYNVLLLNNLLSFFQEQSTSVWCGFLFTFIIKEFSSEINYLSG
jgi:hypothetical protein